MSKNVRHSSPEAAIAKAHRAAKRALAHGDRKRVYRHLGRVKALDAAFIEPERDGWR
jgi:hypothetical protein